MELNHAPGEDGTFPIANGFTLSSELEVHAMGPQSGGGEDEPIEYRRLQRDRWTIHRSDEVRMNFNRNADYSWTFEPPMQFARPVGHGASLIVFLHARSERMGRHYVQTAEIEQGATRRALGRIDWADADHTGDVLYAAAGNLYRIGASDLAENEVVLVADLNGMTFEPMIAPPDALR